MDDRERPELCDKALSVQEYPNHLTRGIAAQLASYDIRSHKIHHVSYTHLPADVLVCGTALLADQVAGVHYSAVPPQ